MTDPEIIQQQAIRCYHLHCDMSLTFGSISRETYEEYLDFCPAANRRSLVWHVCVCYSDPADHLTICTMERLPNRTDREKTFALRNQINDRLGRLDPSVITLIRLEFLLALAEVIKDRKLGMWLSPCAVETAALSVRARGLTAAIESARPSAEEEEAEEEEAGASEEIQKLPVPVTYWRTVLFLLEAAQKNMAAD